jgi:1-acyl-sn-glycerol-3-phosphate acyltransferase
VVLGIVVLLWVPLVGITRLLTLGDAGRYQAGRMFRRLAVVHQTLNPLWTFTVTGDVPSDPRRPYVVVANHESFVDILLISHIPIEMKWMSKSEFFKIPLVGWLMRMAGDIRLDRDDKRSGVKALQECRDRLAKKVSVMIFPEGTRSKSGELQEFKDGAFRLAIDQQVPIIPLAVIGTRDALIKHDWRFGYSNAEVRVLEPISVDGLTRDDLPELRERTRDVIAAALTQMTADRSSDSRRA